MTHQCCTRGRSSKACTIATTPSINAHRATTSASAATDAIGRVRMRIPTTMPSRPRSTIPHLARLYAAFRSFAIMAVLRSWLCGDGFCSFLDDLCDVGGVRDEHHVARTHLSDFCIHA